MRTDRPRYGICSGNVCANLCGAWRAQ
jgi:hypothetical protein